MKKRITPVCAPMPQTLSDALNVLRDPGGGLKLVSHGFQSTKKSALDDLTRAVRRMLKEEGITTYEARVAFERAITEVTTPEGVTQTGSVDK